MTRNFKPVRIRGAFWICVLLIVILLSVPYIGDGTAPWKNGLYDAVSILIVFPLLVYPGASGKITDKKARNFANCWAIYLIRFTRFTTLHVSLLCLVMGQRSSLLPGLASSPVALCGNILLAYLLLKFYDEPVRRYLTGKLRRGERNSEARL